MPPPACTPGPALSSLHTTTARRGRAARPPEALHRARRCACVGDDVPKGSKRAPSAGTSQRPPWHLECPSAPTPRRCPFWPPRTACSKRGIRIVTRRAAEIRCRRSLASAWLCLPACLPSPSSPSMCSVAAHESSVTPSVGRSSSPATRPDTRPRPAVCCLRPAARCPPCRSKNSLSLALAPAPRDTSSCGRDIAMSVAPRPPGSLCPVVRRRPGVWLVRSDPGSHP